MQKTSLAPAVVRFREIGFIVNFLIRGHLFWEAGDIGPHIPVFRPEQVQPFECLQKVSGSETSTQEHIMVKCDICLFDNPDGFAYCGRCGNGLSISNISGNGFAGSAIEGERKQVTIIFADISGFTALNDAAKTQADVERVIQTVNHCLQMLSEVVHEYDGYIDKYMGDAIMAIFGAPRSHEDDPERALRAALAMRDRLEDFNNNPPFSLAEPLDIHLGINTGTVIAGLIGTTLKRAYTVMGDAVNVTARLESVSERGEFLVSQSTYNFTNRLFVFKEREPVRVKGKREALVIYELIDARSEPGSQRGIAGLRSPMVGRKKQFATLIEQVQAIKAGQGQIAVVVGEAGLGKSRLISELEQKTSQEDPDITWLEGRALSYRQKASYKLFTEIMRQYLKVGPDEAGDVLWFKWQAVGKELFGDRYDEVIPYLGMLMGVKLDEKLTQNMPLSDPNLLQHRMFMAVGEWVEALAAKTPVVLVFEDLHWADPNSIRMIEYLMTIAHQLPLLLICNTRPEKEIDFWALKKRAAKEYSEIYHELTLSPLTEDQSRYLVDQLLQVEQLPDVLENLILSRSEGNPLFVEEVLRSLIEDSTLVKEGNSWVMARPITEINIPETLTGVLTTRIDRLDEPVKRALQIASVIGRIFPHSILKAVSDDAKGDKDTLEQHIVKLIAAELIREHPNDTETEYIFKHVLTYETTYNILLLQQRRVYHKRIADHMAPMYYMRGEEYAAIVARHYEQGEVWHRALTYLIRAAEASKTTFDNDNAIDFYTRALNVSELVSDLEPATLINIYQGRGSILRRLGKVDQARADFEKLLELAKASQNLTAQMRALMQLGQLQAGYQTFSRAAPYFEEALAIARQKEDESGIVDTLNQLGNFTLNMGQLNEASAYFEEALTLAGELSATRYIAASKDGLVSISLYRGQISNSIEELEKLVKIWRNIADYQGLLKTYASLAAAYTIRGAYAQSEQTCANAMEIQERAGDLNWAPYFSYQLAQNALAAGNLKLASENTAKTVKVARQLGNGIWQSMGLAQSGFYHLVIGEPELGLMQIQEAVTVAEQTGSPLWTGRANRLLGVAHRYQNKLAKAQTILETVWQDAQEVGFISDQIETLIELLKVYVAAKKWKRIAPLLQQLNELTTPDEMPAYQAQALVISARHANHHQDYNEAVDMLIQARNIAQTTGAIPLEAPVEIALIESQISLGHSNRAQTSFNQARRVLHDVAKSLKADDTKANFLKNAPMAKQLRHIQNTYNL